MATIKGQNLRLLVNHNDRYKCLASSTAAQLHIGVATEESSTNDSEGDWQEIDVTGKSWDMSSEALVVDGIREAGSYEAKTKATVKDAHYDVYYDPSVSVALKEGETITIYSGGSYGICLLNEARTQVLRSGATGQGIITFTAETGVVVVPAFSGTNLHVTTYAVKEVVEEDAVNTIDLLSMANQKVIVKMAVTDPTSAKNREILQGHGAWEIRGEAVINDIQINSANRQRPTCSIKLQGSGQLV